MASVAPAPPEIPSASVVTPAGFDAGQYSTFTLVKVRPAPTVIGTVPVTDAPFSGPPIQPCVTGGDCGVSVHTIDTGGVPLMFTVAVLRARAVTVSVPGFVPAYVNVAMPEVLVT